MDKFDEKALALWREINLRSYSGNHVGMVAQALRDTAAEYWRKGQENMRGRISGWIGYRIQVIEGNDPKLNKPLSEWLAVLPIEPVPEEV